MPLISGGKIHGAGGKTYDSSAEGWRQYKADKKKRLSSSSSRSSSSSSGSSNTRVKSYSSTSSSSTSSGGGDKPSDALLQIAKSAGIKDLTFSGMNITALNKMAQDRLAELKNTDDKLIPTGEGGVTSDSDDAKREEEQLRKNIADDLEKFQRDMERQIRLEREALENRRQEEIENINSDYDRERTDTETAQSQEMGQRTMDLARMGGYLGNTASHAGVLKNLAVSQKAERDRLENSRQDALRAANNAYEDRDFELAREKLQLASDIEQEIYNRQQEFDEINRNLREQEQAELKNNQEQTDIYNSITRLGEGATSGEIFKDLGGRVPIESINSFLQQMRPSAGEGDFQFSSSNTAALLGAGMSRDEIQEFNDYINDNGYDDKIRATLTTAQRVAADGIFRDIKKTTGGDPDDANEPLSILDIQRLEDTYGILFPLGVTHAEATQFIKDNAGASAADMQAAIDQLFGNQKENGVTSDPTGFKIEVTEEWLRANLTKKQLKKLADTVEASKWWTYKSYDIDRMFETPEFFDLLKSKIQALRDQGITDTEILIALTT